MADLTTYEGLKEAIADYLGRDDLEERIPTFIRLAEVRMNRDIRARVMERRAVRDIEAGCRGVKLPADRTDGAWNVFMEMRDLVWHPQGGRTVNLHYVTPDEYRMLGERTGVPSSYTIVGDDLFLLPVPEGAGRLELTFYAEIPPLSDKQECNPLLHTAPDLYLYASLMESVPFTRGSVPLQEWMQAYSEAVDKLNHQESRARFTSNLKMRPARGI